MEVSIGQKYLSNIVNSSGRTYEVKDIKLNQSTFTEMVNFKDVNSPITATYSLYQVKEWIREGRLILVKPYERVVK